MPDLMANSVQPFDFAVVAIVFLLSHNSVMVMDDLAGLGRLTGTRIEVGSYALTSPWTDLSQVGDTRRASLQNIAPRWSVARAAALTMIQQDRNQLRKATMSHIEQAFYEVCKNAQPVKGSWISLYVTVPYYGGAEEGGWWGADVELVASQWADTPEQAEAMLDAVKTMAAELSGKARQSFYQQCRAECDWLDARGLDSDYLLEPDGEEKYLVTTEEERGSCISRGSRYYE